MKNLFGGRFCSVNLVRAFKSEKNGKKIELSWGIMEENRDKECDRMSLTPAICSRCGAVVQVNSNDEATICSYCNTPFITEKAINQYIVVNGNQTKTAKDYFEKAISYYKIGEKEKGTQELIEAQRLDPNNGEILFYRGVYDESNFWKVYLKKFTQMQPYEVQWIKKLSEKLLAEDSTGDYGSKIEDPRKRFEYYELYRFFTICLKEKLFSRCEFVIRQYPSIIQIPELSLNGLEQILQDCGFGMSLWNSEFFTPEWPDIEIMKFYIENDSLTKWNPYIEQEKYAYHSRMDMDHVKRYVSAYNIISQGGKAFSYRDSPFDKYPPNYELAAYIKQKYSMPDRRTASNQCPLCGKKLNLLGKCTLCKKYWR